MKRPGLALLLFAVFALAYAADDFDSQPAAVRELLAPARGQWSQLAGDDRAALLAAAQRWRIMTTAQRAALRARIHDWDAQPASTRSRRRAPFAAWQRLSTTEQHRIRLAAAAYLKLPGERQQALRATFARLPIERQQVWLLGPELAPDVIAVGGLFAFVPQSEREALLDVVRGLPLPSRMQLAQLGARMNQTQLAALRGKLIAATPEQRPQLIEQALAK